MLKDVLLTLSIIAVPRRRGSVYTERTGKGPIEEMKVKKR